PPAAPRPPHGPGPARRQRPGPDGERGIQGEISLKAGRNGGASPPPIRRSGSPARRGPPAAARPRREGEEDRAESTASRTADGRNPKDHSEGPARWGPGMNSER